MFLSYVIFLYTFPINLMEKNIYEMFSVFAPSDYEINIQEYAIRNLYKKKGCGKRNVSLFAVDIK